jgi:hypothetical protein
MPSQCWLCNHVALRNLGHEMHVNEVHRLVAQTELWALTSMAELCLEARRYGLRLGLRGLSVNKARRDRCRRIHAESLFPPGSTASPTSLSLPFPPFPSLSLLSSRQSSLSSSLTLAVHCSLCPCPNSAVD